MTLSKEDRDALISDIAAAIRVRNTDTNLTEDEQHWVRLAIQREGQTIRFRQAIIEKTLMGLIWAAIVGLGTIFFQWAVAHGFKP